MQTRTGALVGEAHANPGLQMKIAEQRELTGRGDDLDRVAHRTRDFAHAIVPKRFALLLPRAGQRKAHRLPPLIDGDEIRRHDARQRER
jgi:hypothetical protein